MRIVVRIASLVLGAAILLTGCAADPVETAAPEAPSPTPTPTPTEVAAVKPDTAFPVSCDDLDLSGIETAVGRELPLNTFMLTPFALASAHQNGSVYCNFGESAANREAYLVVTGQTHPWGQSDPAGPASCVAAANSCSRTIEVEGMRLYAYLQHPAGASAEAAFTAMTDAFVALAIDRGRPADWVAPAGAAPAIFDCAQFASLDIAWAVGSGELILRDTTTFSEGEMEPPSREELAGGGLSRCSWTGGDTVVNAFVLSGGAWLGDEATSLTPSDIAGADLAFRQCRDARPCGAVAIVGLDAIAITVGGEYAATTMTEADAFAAAELIVPAFAAL